ncbi:V protein [Meliandou mastomys virus]|uniref:Non-structural protein V n=1 Tax=Meliandou mastomys virus TaxID=2940987 RepID=A0AAE9KYK0_9MONO|nr:V protein [Meliandou mastomys virus]
MTSYTTSELKKLVQDGMETIEFIQQNKEDIQKTYGRSAIEKPSTKERTVAWEKFTKDKNLRGEMGTRGLGSNQGGKEEGGKPNAEDSRQDRGRGTAEGSDHGSNSSGETIQPINLTNYPHNCERNRPNTGHEKVDDAKPGCSFSGGTEDNSGGHSASYITTSDYNQILNFDEETNKVETDPSHQTTMTIRDATADDLGLVLTGEPGNVHKRLRGITSSTLEPINEAGPSSGIKKGHRREYCIDTFGGKVYVREWCNPVCSKITTTPVQQKCVCGECPRVCSNCIKDRELYQRHSDYTRLYIN